MSLTSGKRIIRNKWTILPMPAKVIATVHQLAAACKKYKGIVFMDKDGNIINDDNNDDSNEDNTNTLEITGVDMTNNDDTTNNDDMTTGVDTINNDRNTNNNTLDITGLYSNMEDTETVTRTQVANTEHNIAPHTENETESETNDTGHNKDENYEQYDDDMSIEDGSLEDMNITIIDMNTVHEMKWK